MHGLFWWKESVRKQPNERLHLSWYPLVNVKKGVMVMLRFGPTCCFLSTQSEHLRERLVWLQETQAQRGGTLQQS